VFKTLVCQLQILKPTSTSDPHLATCQPESVSLVRNLQHAIFLAVDTFTNWIGCRRYLAFRQCLQLLIQVFAHACRCMKGFDKHCNLPISMLSAQIHRRCRGATALWCDHTVLESSCVRATRQTSAVIFVHYLVSAYIRKSSILSQRLQQMRCSCPVYDVFLQISMRNPRCGPLQVFDTRVISAQNFRKLMNAVITTVSTLGLQWSSKVCIQNQSLLGTTVRVRRQLNLTGGTVR